MSERECFEGGFLKKKSFCLLFLKKVALGNYDPKSNDNTCGRRCLGDTELSRRCRIRAV